MPKIPLFPFLPMISDEGYSFMIDESGCGDTAEDNAANMKKILDAFNCAFSERKKCLKETNEAVYQEFLSFFYPLVLGRIGFACTELPEEYAGWTITDDPLTPIIYFDPARVFKNCGAGDTACQKQESETLCSLMLHELMHAARLPDGDDHDVGVDLIYSCARYCGFCQIHGDQDSEDPGERTHPSVDCAICARYKRAEIGNFEVNGIDPKECGYMKLFQEGPCDDTYAVCHSGLGCISAECEQCRTATLYDCDYNKIEETIFENFCCLQCPADCNSSNDFPCETEKPKDEDNCTNYAPPAYKIK